MNNYGTLLGGDLLRMKKYNILAASFFIVFLWIGVLYFTDVRDISSIFPLLLFIDTTSMAIILIGAAMIFEKEEGSLKSLLVSPISKGEYILAKASSNICSNLLTLILLYLYARLFKTIQIHLLGMIGAVLLVSFFHSMLGFFITFYSRTFTDMLMGMMKYFLLMMLPVLFEMLGLLTHEFLLNLLYLLPTKASMTLLLAPAGGIGRVEILFSAFYLLLLSLILYYIVYQRFDSYAIRESGV